MKSLSFAFFPLYPITLNVLNNMFHNIEVAAFIFSNIMMFINFGSIIYVTKKLTSENISIKTAFLLFLFPFSIFYRSYFTENLFLFILIWFSYFWIKKQVLSGVLLGLLNTTRGTGVLLYFPFFYYLYKNYRSKKISLLNASLSGVLSLAPVGLWSLYNFLKTGDFLFFTKILSSWTVETNFITQFVQNINTFFSFGTQDFHLFNSSKVDSLMIFTILLLLIMSYGKLKTNYWLISLCLFLSPLFFNNTMSFSRFQIVSFPLFLYLAMVLKGEWYLITAGAFAVGLFIVSLYFVNWYWVG